jgi:hypothetical protein
MSYSASDPAKYLGDVVGNGQCVAYVRKASGAPRTSKLKKGYKIRGNSVSAGVAVATFQGGDGRVSRCTSA